MSRISELCLVSWRGIFIGLAIVAFVVAFTVGYIDSESVVPPCNPQTLISRPVLFALANGDTLALSPTECGQLVMVQAVATLQSVAVSLRDSTE